MAHEGARIFSRERLSQAKTQGEGLALRTHLVHGGLPPPELTAPAQVSAQPGAQIAHLGWVRRGGEILSVREVPEPRLSHSGAEILSRER